MPPKAAVVEAPKRKTSSAGKKAREMLEDYKSKARARAAKTRTERIPNALMNVGTGMVGALPVGVLRGAIPESYDYKASSGEVTTIPTGLIYDGVATAGGILLTVGGAVAKQELIVHLGGGVATVATAGLAERGSRWLMGYVQGLWSVDQSSGAIPFPGAIR